MSDVPNENDDPRVRAAVTEEINDVEGVPNDAPDFKGPSEERHLRQSASPSPASAYPVGPLEVLAAFPYWHPWLLSKKTGKKPPIDPRTGRIPPRGTDLATIRVTLKEAREVAARLMLSGKQGGIGVVAGTLWEDPDDPALAYYLGYMDLDACRNPETGEITDWARQTVDKFNSYTEVSPSGTGLKIFFWYQVDAAESTEKAPGDGDKRYGYELRLKDTRYSTVTGKLFEHYDQLNVVGHEVFTWVVEVLKPIIKPPTATTATAEPLDDVRDEVDAGASDAQHTLAKVKAALAVLSPDDNQFWIDCAYGMKFEFQNTPLEEAACEDWIDWLRRKAPGLYDHRNGEMDLKAKWAGLKPNGSKKIESIYYAANQTKKPWDRGLKGQPSRRNRPKIFYDAFSPKTMAKEGLKALRACGLPIYQQTGRLIHIVRYGDLNVDTSDEAKFKLKRDADAVVIRDMDATLLGAELTETINWVALKQEKKPKAEETEDKKKKSGGLQLTSIVPPQKIANIAVAMTGQLPLPELNGIVHSPTLYKKTNGDLELLQTPGYDKASGLLFVPNDKFEAISLKPSKADARAALDRLLAPVIHFPFVPDLSESDNDNWMPAETEGAKPSAHRSVYLSALLTGVMRRTMTAAPLHAFDAISIGTGKSKLAQMVGITHTGRAPASMPWVRGEDEQRKRLMSVALEGDLVLLFENVTTSIGGQTINIVLTEPVLRDRLLGRSEIVKAKTNMVVLATGNNMAFEADMTRRVVVCKMNAGVERPQDRQFSFDPVAMVRANRAQMAVDCITILLAYSAADRPLAGKVPDVGSYEEWTFIREAIMWHGEPDPALTMKEVAATDPVADAIRLVMDAWWECYGDTSTALQQAVEDAKAVKERDAVGIDPAQKKLLEALEGISNGKPPSTISLGIWFSKHNQQIYDGRRFKSGGTTGGTNATGRQITLSYQPGAPVPKTAKGVLHLPYEERKRLRQAEVEEAVTEEARRKMQHAVAKNVPM